jgi:hypothetical protein
MKLLTIVFAALVLSLMHASAVATDQYIDLTAYCKTKGFQGVTNVTGNGYGWRCTPQRAGFVINMNQVCTERYGANAKAILLTPAPGGQNDWRCRIECRMSSLRLCHDNCNGDWGMLCAPGQICDPDKHVCEKAGP